MKREKMAWMVSVALVAILALQLPGSLAQRDDDYAFVRTLIDIHRQVVTNYVDPVNESKLREGAIDGMLSVLDPFTMYVPPSRQKSFDQMLEGQFKGVGIQLDQRPDGSVEVITPIDGSPAFRAGVLPGDIILKVNGESIDGLRLPEIVKKIGGKLGSEVTLTVRHATGEEAELKMTRQEIVVPTVKGYQRKSDDTWDYYISEDPKIGYVRITQFTSDTYDSLRPVVEKLLKSGMKGLILDLRYNPGGQLDQAVKVVDMFIDQNTKYHGVIVSTKGRNRPEQVIRATTEGTLPYFPLICLVNEHSASAAEIVSGSLEDNLRAKVAGTRTFGKGSVQELIPLEQNSGELKLTVAYYYLPSGRLVQRRKGATDWGVKPQISIPVTPEQEKEAYEYRMEQELMHGPTSRATTQATTRPATTHVVDIQLQRTVDVMMRWLALGGGADVSPQMLMPHSTTHPTTTTATIGTEPGMPVTTAPTASATPVSQRPMPATQPASTTNSGSE